MINIERAGTGQYKGSCEPHPEITNEMVVRPAKTQLQADLSLRWAHMPIRWFCYDAAQIKAELFAEMTQWKNFMSGYKF